MICIALAAATDKSFGLAFPTEHSRCSFGASRHAFECHLAINPGRHTGWSSMLLCGGNRQSPIASLDFLSSLLNRNGLHGEITAEWIIDIPIRAFDLVESASVIRRKFPIIEYAVR